MTQIGNLWTCTKCGRKLVSRNMYHSCSAATVEDFLRRASPTTRALYAKFESMIAACGPYFVSPAKTRISFMGRVRFGGVQAINDKAMTIGFSLPVPVRSPRLLDVKEVVPGWWVHRLRISRLEELDGELQNWLRQSYRLMGMQERLEKGSASRSRPKVSGEKRSSKRKSARRSRRT